MRDLPIYLDYSATTPCDVRVVDVMLPYFSTYFGNASSRAHQFGWQAAAAVEKARQEIAALVKVEPGEILFTSGATEACNLAIRGVFDQYSSRGNHIITTQTEHKAVLDTCKILGKKGAEITFLRTDESGRVDPLELEAAVRPSTILIAVMYANNETGVIAPIGEIGRIAEKHDVLFFTDATQAAGKIPINVQLDHVHLAAFSSHKIYGPKGVGALYIRRKGPRVRITPQITGGGQEKNLRSGTLNVAGIAGFGAACAICTGEMEQESSRLRELRDRLETALLKIKGSSLNGDKIHRLPHVLNISFEYLNSSTILAALHKTLAISSGSACTSGSLDPSYVLKGMGITDARARGALRFSLGRFTTAEDIDFTISEVRNTASKLQAESFEWQVSQKKSL